MFSTRLTGVLVAVVMGCMGCTASTNDDPDTTTTDMVMDTAVDLDVSRPDQVDTAPDIGPSDAVDVPETDVSDVSDVPPDQTEVDMAPMCTMVCGDADQNGDVGVADRVLLEQVLAGDITAVDACGQAAIIDIFMDGRLTDADRHQLEALLAGNIAVACEECKDRLCGDIDGNGSVNNTDSVALSDLLTSADPLDACTWWAADVNNDDQLTAADPMLVLDYLFNSDTVELNCAGDNAP